MFGTVWTLAWALPKEVLGWLQRLANDLDRRVQGRWVALMIGLLLATGSHSVARWLAPLAPAEHWSRFYYLLFSLGRKISRIVRGLALLLLVELCPTKQVVLILDDTVLRRYGPKVQGAGLHRNPSPAPGEGAFCYGHSWVTLAWALHTPHWGTVAIPLGSKLYVRQKDLEKLPPDWQFQTKPQLALEMILEVLEELKNRGLEVVVVQDGAWTHREYICPLREAGVVVVGRLRKDAALCDLPPPRQPGQRGRPRKYGEHRIDLAKRAGHKRGWQEVRCVLYGQQQRKTIKTFLATYRVAGGLIRVVLVREQDEVHAYFSTNPDWTPQQILEAIADRGSIEQLFRDVKQTWKADGPQLRNVWSNVTSWHMHLWWAALTELWAAKHPEEVLAQVDRPPWDRSGRRVSHAERRNVLLRQVLERQFSLVHRLDLVGQKILAWVSRLLGLSHCSAPP